MTNGNFPAVETASNHAPNAGPTCWPKWLWFTKGNRGLPMWRGSDEWGRHTLVVGIPWLWSVVISYKWCDDADMDEFRCTFPGCQALAVGTNSPCPTHDPEWSMP